MTKLLTYDEVLQLSGNDKRSLLLGNGFSMSYNKDRFSFTSLLDSAIKDNLIQVGTPIYEIFQEFETKDFETVVNLLETATKVTRKYNAITPEDEGLIVEDANKLKRHLVSIITNNHPEKITEISDEEFLCCANFINNYDKTYTLNYDLLLYWAYIKLQNFIETGVIQKHKLKFSDGFNNSDDITDQYVIYANDSTPATIHFLHGALHLFDKKYEIIKQTYSRTSKPLKDQTLENINQEIYPIFVSEGTSQQKKAKIIHNAYLNHCYKSLSNIGGDLVVFGTLLKTNDEHIREAIKHSKVKNIYIGVSSLFSVNEFDNFIEELKNLKKPKNVIFYDYTTAKVWR
ncbi:MAG: DUF4917 family protein [Burkholderiales bacterium]|nr:DUF4917 family protein [Burkholderiales bacterium]